MAAKKKSAPSRKAQAADTAHPAAAVIAVAFRNLVNMAIVATSCATTLAMLMTALKLQIA